jgi:hypothetical protein
MNRPRLSELDARWHVRSTFPLKRSLGLAVRHWWTFRRWRKIEPCSPEVQNEIRINGVNLPPPAYLFRVRLLPLLADVLVDWYRSKGIVAYEVKHLTFLDELSEMQKSAR